METFGNVVLVIFQLTVLPYTQMAMVELSPPQTHTHTYFVHSFIYISLESSLFSSATAVSPPTVFSVRLLLWPFVSLPPVPLTPVLLVASKCLLGVQVLLMVHFMHLSCRKDGKISSFDCFSISSSIPEKMGLKWKGNKSALQS